MHARRLYLLVLPALALMAWLCLSMPQPAAAKPAVEMSDGRSVRTTDVIDTLSDGGGILALLDAERKRSDEQRAAYAIRFSSHLSAEEASRYIGRAYLLCLQREAGPFTLKFDLIDCPSWACECRDFIEEALRAKGQSIEYDSAFYEHERPLAELFVREQLAAQGLPVETFVSMLISDFYLADPSLRADGPTVLGWVTLDISPGRRPQLLLREKPAPPVGDNWTPLHLAAECGDLAELRRLLDSGANPDAASRTGRTPLELAAQNGRTDAVRTLLAAGVEKRKTEALEAASGEGYTEIVRLLLDAGAPPQGNGEKSPLLAAVAGGHEDCLRLLLDAGADPDARTPGGRRPVEQATLCREFGALEILVRAGAHLDVPGLDDVGLLPGAIESGNSDGVRALLALGANPNLADDQGRTPLHIAVSKPWSHWACPLLLDAGADPNARDASGDTPLHLAARLDARELLSLLIDSGGDPHLNNSAGQSPEALASTIRTLRQARHGALEVDGMYTLPDGVSFSSVTVRREAGIIRVMPDGDESLTPEQFRRRLSRYVDGKRDQVLLFRLCKGANGEPAPSPEDIQPWISVCDDCGIRTRHDP